MPDSKADVLSYSALVHICAKAGDLAGAEELVGRMKAAGVEMNVVTYNSVLNACARSGNATRAEDWLRRMEEAGVKPNLTTCNTAMNAFGRSNMLEKAEKCLQDMPGQGLTPDGVSFKTLVDVCASAGDPVRAERILEWMLKGIRLGAVATNSRQSNSDCLFTSMRLVIQAWWRAQNAAKAAHWLSVAMAEGMRMPDTLVRQVADAFVAAGNHTEASHLMSLAQRANEGSRRAWVS